MLNNKNILITGISNGIGKRLFLVATEDGGIVCGNC